MQKDRILAALAPMQRALAQAKFAEASDRVAVQVIERLELKVEEILQAVERLERLRRELTPDEYAAAVWDQYAAARQVLNSTYRALGDAQAVAAIAGQRRGGYKGAKAKNIWSAVTPEKQEQIKVDFVKAIARTDLVRGENDAYRIVARKHKLNARTIRRIVTGKR